MGQGVFDIFTAFSRQPGQPKQYVQDLITEESWAAEIIHLVWNCNAHIYICGNASRMAKDVTKALERILSEGNWMVKSPGSLRVKEGGVKMYGS